MGKFKLVSTEWREKYDREEYTSAVILENDTQYLLWQLETDKDGYFHTGRKMWRGKKQCRELDKTVPFKEVYPELDYYKMLIEELRSESELGNIDIKI